MNEWKNDVKKKDAWANFISKWIFILWMSVNKLRSSPQWSATEGSNTNLKVAASLQNPPTHIFMCHAASNFAWITRSAFWPTKSYTSRSKVTQLETQNILRDLKHCISSIVNTKYRASIYTTIQCRIWRWEEFNALMRWRQSAKQHFTYNSINWPQKEDLFIRLYSFVAFTTERKSFCTRTISGIKTCPDTGPLLQCSNGLKEDRSINL